LATGHRRLSASLAESDPLFPGRCSKNLVSFVLWSSFRSLIRCLVISLKSECRGETRNMVVGRTAVSVDYFLPDSFSRYFYIHPAACLVYFFFLCTCGMNLFVFHFSRMFYRSLWSLLAAGLRGGYRGWRENLSESTETIGLLPNATLQIG